MASRHARAASRASASTAIRRRRSIRRRSASRRRPLQVMNGYQYLPFFTFGSFSTTNSELDDRVARLAALGLERGLQPADDDDVRLADGDARRGATTRSAPATSFRHQTLEHHERPAIRAGAIAFNGALHARQQLRRRSTIARSPGRSSCSGLPTVATGAVATTSGHAASSQFEIASPGEFSQTTHGFFVQDDWRVSDRLTRQPRASPRGQQRHDRKSQNRNLAGFDTTTPNPIEAPARAAYAANPDSGDSRRRISRSWAAAVRRRPGEQHDDQVSAARARPPIASASKTVSAAASACSRTITSSRTSTRPASRSRRPIMVTQRQRHHVHRCEPDAIRFRAASSSSRWARRTGLLSQLGQNLGHALSAGSRDAVLHALGVHRAARSRRWLRRRVHLPRIARQQSAGRRGRSTTSRCSTCRRRATRDAANETFLSADGAQPVRRPACRAATINGATVARSQLLRPYPEFGTFAIEEYTGSDRYSAATVQLEKRFRSGNSFTMQYTHSSLRDKLNYLNPADGILEDRVSPNDRPNRFSLGTSLRLPFGKGEKWGTDWNGASTRSSAAGGERHLPVPVRLPADLRHNIYYDAACGDPTSLKSNIGKNVDRRHRRTRRAGLGHLVLLLPRRARCRPTASTTR